MFNFTLRRIAVTFLDEATGAIVASFRMPLDRLPDAFVVDTGLKMNGAEYVVVSASPATKGEFANSRELKVVLRRRAFSAPTSTP